MEKPKSMQDVGADDAYGTTVKITSLDRRFHVGVLFDCRTDSILFPTGKNGEKNI